MIKYALKDNIVCKGKITQAASNVLRDYVSSFNSTIVDQLDGDYISVNMDEFGFGSYGVHSAYGPVSINGRVAGGSSSGCAAAVKLEHCLVGIGTDTGGSIRLPAAFCNLIGFKPSYGRISRYGVIAYAQSLDTVGLLSKSLNEVIKTFKILDKYDDKDPTSIPTSLRKSFVESKDSFVIGVPRNVKDEKFQQMVSQLRGNPKLKIKKISLPHFKYSLACYYIIATAEAYSSLNRYSGLLYPAAKHNKTFEQTRKLIRDLFGKEVKNRLELGGFVLNNEDYEAWFLQATKVRRLIQMDYKMAFQHVDYVILPTTLQEPPLVKDVLDPKVSDYNSDCYTVGPSLAGTPVLSIPLHRYSVQVIAPFQNDNQLLNDVLSMGVVQ
eukprot:NODE_1_length_95616_cov_0.657642.p19 type:complete len:381 gc:universal NODE_1_length_95616_cov_0.657642:1748-2890(+)